MTDAERATLLAELAAVEDRIARGYWAFSRTKRGRLASVEDYRRRAELRRLLGLTPVY